MNHTATLKPPTSRVVFSTAFFVLLMDVIKSSAVAAVAIVVTAGSVAAMPITVPADLSLGDQYRLAFHTSTERDATSTDIAVYNTFVTAVANTQPALVALGTTWTAIVSTGNTTATVARTNTQTLPSQDDIRLPRNEGSPFPTGVPIYRLDGLRIANHYDDLWDGSLLNPIETTESGDLESNAVWTGTRFHGGIDSSPLPLGSPIALIGATTRSDLGRWIQFSTLSILDLLGDPSTQNFYGISGTLTIVPEPGTMLLFGSGIAGLAAWRRKHAGMNKA